jgi:HEAT repeat protein
MKRQHAFLFLVLMAVTFGIIWALSGRAPRYHGRTLTSWLRQCSDSPLNETHRLQEAQNAIRTIGAKEALPKLLNLVEATDDPVSLWLIAKTDKYRTRFLRWKSSERYSYDDWQRSRWHSAEDFQQLGIAGFEVLGTNAGTAVGELEKLLQKTDHTFTAKRCLVFVGKPAELVFVRALTNQNPGIRQWGMDELAAVTDDVEVYITRIKDRLNDSSEAVRADAVDDIGIQTTAPELAVPLLVSALQDGSDSVSAHAASSLANFGANALGACLTLSNLVESGGSNTACAALKALVVIAPNESFSILTNCIGREKPGINEALKSLREVAPERALPIILDRCQSRDLQTRRAAFRLLCRYPITPPIESALQTAAADSDFTIGRRAKQILTEHYQKMHPSDSPFADEPSFAGKRLGDWLKLHDAEGQLSQAATNAIHHLGANAIPALLQRLTYSQPPFGLRTREVNLVRMDGVRGLIALGNGAVPAIPALQALMDSTNQDTVVFAMVCTLGTGTNAIPTLIKGLTNQFAEVRSQAVHGLAESIALRFPDRRQEIMPLLANLVRDPDPEVRGSVKGDLQEIDAASASGQK